MKTIRNLMLVSLLLLAGRVSAQYFQFMGGYSAGRAYSYELNRTIYVYNQIRSKTLSKPMDELRWNKGFNGGFRLGNDFAFGELLMARKKTILTSMADSAGISLSRQMKVQYNTWNWGMGVRYKGFVAGASMDFGRFKGKGRLGRTDEIDDMKWQELWTLSDFVKTLQRAIPTSYTLYIEYDLEWDGGFLGLRLYSQFGNGRQWMDGLDRWLLYDNLNFASQNEGRMTTFGASILLGVGPTNK